MVPEYGIDDTVTLDQLGLVVKDKTKFDEEKHVLSVTFDSFHDEYFAAEQQNKVDAPVVLRSKTFSITMFQRVTVVTRIKTEKRELDLGLRVVLDETGLKVRGAAAAPAAPPAVPPAGHE